MAARRNKSQARRTQSNGLPGWAWLVLGILLTLIVVLVASSWLKSDGDDFFRPQANPDARPLPVSTADDELPAPSGRRDAGDDGKERSEDFAFYDLLTGKEVPMTDAELAATQRAESQRQAELERQRALRALNGQADAQVAAAEPALPEPVTPDAATPARTAPDTPVPAQAPTTQPAAAVAPVGNANTAAGVGDGSRYILQAGAFRASGQAEELKARIALLGLGARVEPAQIDGTTVYRVRMGPYGTASDLADAKRKLESGGLQALAIRAR
ncbi:SPOR domain-containing protein [Marilutibacter alkalisoli]|uniref:Sporulation protein n=1 Tax=Marilutibacter alkalisoli TaxID=2591633 RepID=A0A514BND4_9GAMM|nr:SPOR domain-containing protein [Lysobacter alkalisoli]QDH68835.1 sporulation protein [Lysobacter alkalisoli]